MATEQRARPSKRLIPREQPIPRTGMESEAEEAALKARALAVRRGRRERVGAAQPIERDKRKATVETYRDLIREAEAARLMARKAKEERDAAVANSDKEKIASADVGLSRWLELFTNAKRQIAQIREQHGDALEQAHRQYIHEQVTAVEFSSKFAELSRVENAIRGYAPDTHGFTPNPKKPGERRKRGVIAEMARGHATTLDSRDATGDATEDATSAPAGEEQAYDIDELETELADSLDYIFDDPATVTALTDEITTDMDRLRAQAGGDETQQELNGREDLSHLSLARLKELQEELYVEAEEQWNKPGVKDRWFRRQLGNWIDANLRGDRVLEFPSVIQHLNELDDIERTYQNTTIGAVVVGEPGVGKTTLIEHYLEKKGRGYVYIDMSEEVTRYQLFGSPSLKQDSSMDQYQHFAERIAAMSEDDIAKLIREHAEKLEQSMQGMTPEEREVIALSQIREELDKADGHVEDAMKLRLQGVRAALEEVVNKHYRSETAIKLMDVTKKNGWRDGVVIHALRNGHSLIIDEFNKAKSWTLIHRLATSRPGEDFFFADNNENIPIPKDWRMYFTGNIGKQHGTFGVRQAFASRIGGKVLEVDVPPSEEERTAMFTFLSDSDHRLMRPDADIVRLMYFVKDTVPSLRGAIKDQRNTIPISYRLFRDLAEQLVDYQHEQPRPTSVDRAVFNVLIRPYAVFETRDIPEQLIKLCHAAGLLISEEVQDEVIKWAHMTKEDLETLRGERKEVDLEQVVREFYKETEKGMTAQMPVPSAT